MLHWCQVLFPTDGPHKRVRKRKKEKVTVLNRDVMDSLWNVPQREYSELSTTTAGVAFATPEETREALARPKASVPQVILCTKDLNDIGVAIDVPVTNGHGKPDSRFRYLFQIGTGEV